MDRRTTGSSECPSPETLAAFADGGLSPVERAAVEVHLADCPTCRQALAGSHALRRDLGWQPASSQRIRPSAIWAAVGTLAAAAALVMIVWLPRDRSPHSGSRPELDELVAAVGKTRYIEPRVAAGFPYGPLRSTTRGATDIPPDVQIAAARIQKALEGERTGATLGAYGVSRLVLGDPGAGVASLEEATRMEPASPRLWCDLSAAYLTAAARTVDSAEQSARALDAAERAISLDRTLAEAWFNRALAIERLPPADDDRGAWESYLAVETDQAWREEGQRRLEQGTKRPAGSSRDWRSRLDEQVAAQAIDRGAVAAAPQASREYLEDELLPRWGGAFEAGRLSDATALLTAAREIAEALSTTTGDPLPRDAVAALATLDERRLGALARGHRAYGAGRRAYDADRYDEAGRAFAESDAALASAGSPFRAWATLRVAQVSYQRRDLDRAYEGLRDVIATAGERGYLALAARGYWMRGIAQLQLGDLAAALDSYRAALVLLERIGEDENAAALCNTAADTLRILGERGEGWKYLSRALARLDTLRDPTRRYVTLLNASLYAEQEGLRDASLHFQNASIEAGRARGGAAPEVEGLTRRASLHVRRKDVAAALGDLAAGEAALARIEDPGMRAYLAAGIDKVRGELLATEHPRDAVVPLTRATEFFRRAEPAEVPALLVARGRAQLAYGDSPSAAADFGAAIEQLETRRNRLPHEVLRISYLDAGWDAFAEMIRLQVQQQGSPDTALAYAERARARALVDRYEPSLQSPDRILEAFQQLLGPSDAGLYFAIVPERLLTWVITRDTRHFDERAVDGVTLERNVERFHVALQTASAEPEIRHDAAELYDLLIRPHQSLLAGRSRLVIVPDGTLHALPFAALFDARRERFLAQDFGLTIVPGAAVFVETTRRMRRRTGQGIATPALLIGDPALDVRLFPGLASLANAAAEVTELADVYPDHELLLGRDATRDRFLALAPRARIVHFAGHALANREYPWFSRLLFAGPPDNEQAASLFAHEISKLDLSGTDLVVLAACDTGRGVVYRGEGAVSLARPFLAAGVPAVTASLWKVDDRAARELFRRFHQKVRHGDDPASALAAAQNAMLASDDPYLRHPGRWAGFVNIGGFERRAERYSKERP